MRITILANRDLAAGYALNMLVDRLDGHDVTIFLSDRIGSGRKKPAALRALSAYERALLEYFQTRPLPDPFALSRPLRSFDALGEMTGKPVLTLNRINQGEDFLTYASSQPDLVVSMRYGVILKQPVIDLPSLGVVNLHSGLLPDYRGVMATFRAMMNGEQEQGTTLHYITDDSIDTGPVIGTTCVPLDARKSYLWNMLRLYDGGCERILETIGKLASGEPVPVTAQSREGTYYTFPSDEELDTFREAGYGLFDPPEF